MTMNAVMALPSNAQEYSVAHPYFEELRHEKYLAHFPNAFKNEQRINKFASDENCCIGTVPMPLKAGSQIFQIIDAALKTVIKDEKGKEPPKTLEAGRAYVSLNQDGLATGISLPKSYFWLSARYIFKQGWVLTGDALVKSGGDGKKEVAILSSYDQESASSTKTQSQLAPDILHAVETSDSIRQGL